MRLFSSGRWTRCLRISRATLVVSVALASFQLLWHRLLGGLWHRLLGGQSGKLCHEAAGHEGVTAAGGVDVGYSLFLTYQSRTCIIRSWRDQRNSIGTTSWARRSRYSPATGTRVRPRKRC